MHALRHYPRTRSGAVAPGAVELLRFPKFEERTTNAFRWALVEMARKLDLDPSYIAAVMSVESNFDSKLSNQLCIKATGDPNKCATGLIQFMPNTAKAMGTSTTELRAMSPIAQLEYVRRFYAPYKGRLKTPGDFYIATFCPALIGKAPETVVFERGVEKPALCAPNVSSDRGYQLNAGLDLDKDGKITVRDVTTKITRAVNAARGRSRIVVTPESPATKKRGGMALAAIGLGALGLVALGARS